MGNHPNERCDERGGGSVVELEDILNRSELTGAVQLSDISDDAYSHGTNLARLLPSLMISFLA